MHAIELWNLRNALPSLEANIPQLRQRSKYTIVGQSDLLLMYVSHSHP